MRELLEEYQRKIGDLESKINANEIRTAEEVPKDDFL